MIIGILMQLYINNSLNLEKWLVGHKILVFLKLTQDIEKNYQIYNSITNTNMIRWFLRDLIILQHRKKDEKLPIHFSK